MPDYHLGGDNNNNYNMYAHTKYIELVEKENGSNVYCLFAYNMVFN